MATVAEQAEQTERDQMIAQLKAQRAEVATKLQAIETKLQAAEDGDFMARVGSADLKTLSVRERSEIVAKIGAERFPDLVLGRR